MWNIGPAHDRRRTVLDDLPTPTDQMLTQASASCPLCGRSAGEYRTGQNRQILGPGAETRNRGLVE
jgi:hypothetical protein